MRITTILVLVCIVSFLAVASLSPDKQTYIINRYGFSGQNLFTHPEVLLTSIFLHSSVNHLLSNILVLFFFGIALESEVGKKKTLLIFLLGAAVGDIFSLSFYFLGIYPWAMPSIGASAGVFAVIGAAMLIKPFDFSLYPYFLPIPLGLLGLIYAVYNAIGFVSGPSNISYIAHFGGLFLGLCFGFQYEGWRRGLKIILVMFVVMILIPYIWTAAGQFL